MAELPDGVEPVALQDARKNLSELVHRAWLGDQVTYLAKHGRPVAALVPVEAARSRAQVEASAEVSAVELARMRAEHERLQRAAEEVLSADEVWWVRAYLRLWELLETMDNRFEAAVEDAVRAELDERERPDGDDEDGWGEDEERGYLADPYLGELRRLRRAEEARRDFARRVEADVQQRVDGLAAQPDRAEVLDWQAWHRRIEHLAAKVAASKAAGAEPLHYARSQLREALVEAAALLDDVQAAPSGEPPADVTGYLAREIWTDAAKVYSGPLITTIATLARGSSWLSPDMVRRSLGELAEKGRISCHRYFHGQRVDVDVSRIVADAHFHLVLHGQLEGFTPPRHRPVIITDM